jgi:endoribonuclease Dicer
LKANANLYGSSLENAKKGISKLHKTFLYCTANLGVWLAAKVRTYDDACLYYICIVLKCINLFFQAAEVQSTTNEQFLPFWGDEKLDKNVEGFVRNYSEEVYRELSCFSTRGRRAVAIIFCLFNIPFSGTQLRMSNLM